MPRRAPNAAPVAVRLSVAGPGLPASATAARRKPARPSMFAIWQRGSVRVLNVRALCRFRLERLRHLRSWLAAERDADLASGSGGGLEIHTVRDSETSAQVGHVLGPDICQDA